MREHEVCIEGLLRLGALLSQLGLVLL
jgi:hypothetical protein